MKLSTDIHLHTWYTDWPDRGAVMKGQQNITAAPIIIKFREENVLNLV